jgi:rhodanese-related sulfurtransferase
MKANQGISILFMLIITMASCERKGSLENDKQLEKAVVELPPDEFSSKLSSTTNAVLIDVRKPEEVAEGKIDGAVNIDYTDSSFPQKIAELDKSKPYFVYCKSGKRSSDAAQQMEKLGFENIFVLEGGYAQWLEHEVKHSH